MGQDKHILIVSQESEKSTDEVLKYLLILGGNYIRINNTDIIKDIEFSINQKSVDIRFAANGREVSFSKIKSVWYRRGSINITSGIEKLDLTEQERELYNQYFKFYLQESGFVWCYPFFRQVPGVC